MTVARAVAPAPSTLADAIGAACSELGARVSELELALAGQEPADQDTAVERAVEGVLGEGGGIDLLAVDTAGMLRATALGEGSALLASMEASWSVTRAVAGAAFLAEQHGGRIAYLAPAPDAGEHAGAACAGLENLARTLSIEWARYGITTVTVAPAADTSDAELGTLVGYLASPAGAYFSGCLLDLRGVAVG